MKFNLYTVGCLLLTVAMTSCSDYLKEDSGDLLIPKKVDEFQAVLFGEGYPHTFANDVAFIDLMTDDVTVMNGLSDNPDDGYDTNSIPTGRGAYLWAYDVEYYINDYANSYNNRYKNILACNTIIENEATMLGDDSKRNYCVAQAYALRAFNYFCLVNWYGLPYNKETADKDMGVAVRLDSEVTREHFTRSTVAKVYEQINQDLDRALELYSQSSEAENKYLVSEKAALLLKTRVALFMENWDDVIKYGEELYKKGVVLCDLSDKTAEDLVQSNDSETRYSFIDTDNEEIIFNFGGNSSDFTSIATHKYMMVTAEAFAGPMFTVSQEDPDDLFKIYEEGDNRKYAFFMQDYAKYSFLPPTRYRHVIAKYYSSNSDTKHGEAFRWAELLLNLAEGYIRKGGDANLGKAIDLLNELRIARFASESYKALTKADFATSEDLLKFAWEERRRELCFDETHRWTDLRRQGMPRIEHKFISGTGAPVETYVLEEKDRNYTLALPTSETGYNTEIEDYPRRDIKPQ